MNMPTEKTTKQSAAATMNEDITGAWREMSSLGLPYRYGGRSVDGRFEFLIVHPRTGATVTSGRGRTVIQAMSEAAQAGRKMQESGGGIQTA